MDIQGKTILITGAAARIGAHLALGFASRGANIILHYFSSETDAKETAIGCQALGAKVHLVQADLSKEEEILKMQQELDRLALPIDILINNASQYLVKTLMDSTWTDILHNQKVHCASAFMLSKWFASKKPKDGMILNFLDAGLHRYDEQHAPYQLSKRSLADLNQMMAIELAPDIRVNAIAPGPMLPASSHSLDWFKKVVSELPISRAGTLDEILHSALFLIENSYITGQTIFCDGGYHLKHKDLR